MSKIDDLNSVELVTVNVDPKQLNQDFERIHAIWVKNPEAFKHVKRIFQMIKKYQAKTPINSLLRVKIMGPAQEVNNG